MASPAMTGVPVRRPCHSSSARATMGSATPTALPGPSRSGGSARRVGGSEGQERLLVRRLAQPAATYLTTYLRYNYRSFAIMAFIVFTVVGRRRPECRRAKPVSRPGIGFVGWDVFSRCMIFLKLATFLASFLLFTCYVTLAVTGR
ncbi:uncharacterized protein IWZ02DRAFT_438476 [Phyllosticta citriasiana]|uniref:PRA1 family protein n=1 Tax=Phyllosticta citriasiana TaxID=595635 RepID=A0ABR1KJE1_9PEZI